MIREGGETGGEVEFDIDLGRIGIARVLIDGDRLLANGNRYGDFRNDGSASSPQMQIIAVDLKKGEIVKSMELPPSVVKYADLKDGQATIIAQRTDLLTPTIWPPSKPTTMSIASRGM